jgi:transposase
MYLRTIRVPSSNGSFNEYVRVVESYRQDGKVKQRTIADLGRKDMLTELLPKLQRLLLGETPAVANDDIAIGQALTWGPVLVVRTLFEQLGLWEILDRHLRPLRANERRLPTARIAPADRAFALIANRLIRPRSEHGLAGWLETDYVCDRQGRRLTPWWHRHNRVQVHHRQLAAWYSTLDRLAAAKENIEQALYQRLRDLFSLQPDLVLYDITSVYFEGAGPEGFAKHGYSRDGKKQNVQVVVGLVMVQGWPIAHYVWEGNRLDASTVRDMLKDVQQRFRFGRIVLVGDRGMVNVANLKALREDELKHGYLLGLKRRRNPDLDRWLEGLREDRWLDCPMGINVQEKQENRPQTRVQEVPSGDDEQRVFVIDSDERREYEQGKRAQSMARARVKLEALQRRVAARRLVDPTKIGAAAERALRAHHGYRYFDWRLRDGVFEFFEHPVHLEREKRLEGKYVIATSEKDWGPAEAVATYKQLLEVETGFRDLKDVLWVRPIYHRVESRVRAHIFVAALALLVRTMLKQQLDRHGVDMSPTAAMQAVETIRHVTFRVNDVGRSGVSSPSPRANEVLRALGITNLRPPAAPEHDREAV